MSEARPELTFAKLAVGACYADQEVTVSAELVAGYRKAIGADETDHFEAETAGREVETAPPTLPIIWTPPRVGFADWTVPPGGIHTAERWEIIRPVRVGEVLHERISAQEKYTRNDKNYVVFEATFEDADSQLVARGVMTLIWPK